MSPTQFDCETYCDGVTCCNRCHKADKGHALIINNRVVRLCCAVACVVMQSHAYNVSSYMEDDR